MVEEEYHGHRSPRRYRSNPSHLDATSSPSPDYKRQRQPNVPFFLPRRLLLNRFTTFQSLCSGEQVSRTASTTRAAGAGAVNCIARGNQTYAIISVSLKWYTTDTPKSSYSFPGFRGVAS